MKLIQKFLSPIIYIVSFIMIIVVFFQYYGGNEGLSTSTGLYTSYVLLFAAVLGIILGFIITAVSNPQSIFRTLIGVAFIFVIGIISYAVAGDEVTELYKKFDITRQQSKIIGGSLILTYVLSIISILGIILSEVRSALRF